MVDSDLNNWHFSLKRTWKRWFPRELKQTGPGVFIRKDKEKMDLLLRGEPERMLIWSTQKPLERVTSPRAEHNIWVSSKSFSNLSVWSKETQTAHFPSQVTTGACLFRGRALTDLGRTRYASFVFQKKISPGSEEKKLFYKKRLQLQGAGNVSPFGSCIPGAWNTHVPKHAGAGHLHGSERKERLNAWPGGISS